MSEEPITLDQWVSDTANQIEPGQREYVSRFRKNWLGGANQNPALYPLSLPDYEWRSHFEWFLQFETPTNSEQKVKSIKSDKMPTSGTSLITDAFNELDDLGTLITQAEEQQNKSRAGAQPNSLRPAITGSHSHGSEPTKDDQDDLGALIREVEGRQQTGPNSKSGFQNSRKSAPKSKTKAQSSPTPAIEPTPPQSEAGTNSEDQELMELEKLTLTDD